jgi:ADP-ribose pyrophosphatase YjhB (NUDIX family)
VVIVRPGPAGPEVLLIRRGQPPRLGEWSIPGGRQELGETVRETAVREVLEETGLEIANLRLIDVVDAFGKHPDGTLRTQWVLVDFRADWVAGEPTAGGDAAAAAWVPVAKLGGYGLWSETVRVITEGVRLA